LEYLKRHGEGEEVQWKWSMNEIKKILSLRFGADEVMRLKL
jgi:hypothetical protein